MGREEEGVEGGGREGGKEGWSIVTSITSHLNPSLLHGRKRHRM